MAERKLKVGVPAAGVLYGPALKTSRREPRQPRPEPPCGTYARYQRHYKAGEPIDQACRKAASSYMALWRARAGETKSVLVPFDVLGALLAAAPTDVEEWAEARIGGNSTTAAIAVAVRTGQIGGDHA